MTTTEQKDLPVEERIGNVIGKIICLAVLAFFVWGYWTTLAAKLGLF